MGKIVSVVNQKGGVGKTTTAVNLAAAVGAKGKRVLLVDIDPQGNATSGMGVNKKELELTTYDMLVAGAEAVDILIETGFKNVSLLPGSIDLAGAEITLSKLENRESRLKRALSAIHDGFDFVFIDCPPSLGLVTINALTASDTLIIPVQCEYYALEGLTQLINTMRQVKMHYNEHLDIEGILYTMYDSRLRLNKQVMDEVEKFFGKKSYETSIPRNVRLSEAPSYGKPVMYYDKMSKGTKAYKKLADEFLKRNR